MRLLPRRGPAATLTLTPETPLRPTETVTATVALAEAIEGIASATVELGYVNGYRYRWAGRADAAANFDDGSLATTGQVGTSYGSERDTEDWVQALSEPLPVVAGTLGRGAHAVRLRLPSWSPGSSDDTVSWRVRLRIERSGRDVEVDVPLTVLSVAPDPLPELELVRPPRPTGLELDFDIATDRPCYRPGDTVRGVVRLRPLVPITRKGELAVSFVRLRASHPLERTPGSETESFTRPHVVVAKGIELPEGTTVELPFSAVLPAGVAPTTDAVHASLRWYVHARVMFEGLTGGVEAARRAIVVHTG